MGGGFWMGALTLFVVALAGASGFHHKLSRWAGLEGAALPVQGRVQPGFKATERSGREAAWDDLKGKVVVSAYVFTRCPHGCIGVAAQMLKLRTEFGSRPDFQLVSVAVWPKMDDAPTLKAFAEGIGVRPGDPWWFLTGDRERLWTFMNRSLGLAPTREVPEADRLSPEDVVEHDLRAVLIDRQGCVRGHYAVMHPDRQIADRDWERLQTDIRLLLAE